VFVCEDLGRVATLGADAVASAVSLVLAPILATPILVDWWQQRAGAFLVAEGTAVVVANSVALGREHQVWNGSKLDTIPGRPAVTLLALYPDDSVPPSQHSSRVECRPDARATLPPDPEVDAVLVRSVAL
jgi:hypothetical protein